MNSAHLLKLYWPLLVGNLLEWYEFGIYGKLEKQLQDNFFNGSAIATWLGFAVTFAARPLGGFFLGAVGDHFGRRASVNVSIVGMLIGTVGQGLLPTNVLGLPFLVALRVLQGLCTGGEIGAISTYVAETGPVRTLGFSVALIGLTCNVGFLLADGVVALVLAVLGKEAMMLWGWRIPFIVSLIPGLLAIWGRRQMSETAAFIEAKGRNEAKHALELRADVEQQQEQQEQNVAMANRRTSAILEVFMSYWIALLVGIAAMAAYAFLLYGGFIWIGSYLQKQGLGAEDALLVGMIARIIQIVFTVPVGWLADIYGIGLVTLGASCALMATGFPLFVNLALNPGSFTAAILSVGVGYGALGALTGSVFFAIVVELFPTSVRNIGVGVSYNIGFSIFGGLAPVAASASLGLSPYGPGILLSLAGFITAATILGGLVLQSWGVLCMAHLRPELYVASRSACCGGTPSQTKESPDGDQEPSAHQADAAHVLPSSSASH
jgi:MFS family permease